MQQTRFIVMDEFEYMGYSFMVQRDGGTFSLLQYQKMIDLLEKKKPDEIIELGCGQSTRIFEQYTEKYGGRMLSIEQDPGYARKDTRVFSIVEPGTLKIGEKEYRRCNYYDGLEKFLEER